MNIEIKKPRIIYNDDTGVLRSIPPPHVPGMLARAVDYLKGGQVDCVCWCFSTGNSALSYRSNVLENTFDNQNKDKGFSTNNNSNSKNLIFSLYKRGIDYLPQLINLYHEAGISFCASFRMNDAHHKSRPNGSLSSKFWLEHQDLRLWEVSDGISYYNATMDFSYPELRKLRLNSIAEVCEKYDIDGIELDFCRNPYTFQPSEAWAKKDILTDFISEVKNKILDIADKKRTNIKLLVRVPFDANRRKNAGMDINTWVETKIVDILIMSNLFDDYSEDKIGYYQDFCRKNDVLFYPSIEFEPLTNCKPDYFLPDGNSAPKPNYRTLFSAQDIILGARAMAKSFYAQGAQGVYLFNYPCKLFEVKRTFHDFMDMKEVINELGSLKSLEGKNRKYYLWNSLPVYIEAMRPAEYHQTIEFNIAEKEIEPNSTVIVKFIREASDNPHSYQESNKDLAPGYIDTYLNSRKLDDRKFKIKYSEAASIDSGFKIGKHEIIEIELEGTMINCGKNTLAFHIPHLPTEVSPYIYIYELSLTVVADKNYMPE